LIFKVAPQLQATVLYMKSSGLLSTNFSDYN